MRCISNFRKYFAGSTDLRGAEYMTNEIMRTETFIYTSGRVFWEVERTTRFLIILAFQNLPSRWTNMLFWLATFSVPSSLSLLTVPILTPSLIACNLLIFSSRFSPYSTRGSSSPSGRNASATRDWPTQPTPRTTRDAMAFSFSQLLSFHTLYITQNIFK